jgi:hypothetical protein
MKQKTRKFNSSIVKGIYDSNCTTGIEGNQLRPNTIRRLYQFFQEHKMDRIFKNKYFNVKE